MPLGFRVYTQVQRPDKGLVERFKEFNSADLSDAMNKSYTMSPPVGPAYKPIKQAVGTAVTVSIPTGALTVLKEGIERAGPGDVVVVNAYGANVNAVIGANICRGMVHRGVAGLIIDGAVRDITEMRQDGLPVFATGVATTSGPSDGPGEVNVPISCGRIVVNPGDIIVADEDGIVAVPPAFAEDVLERVQKIVAGFKAIQPVLLRGEVTKIADIEKQMKDAGCTFVEGTVESAQSSK